MSDSLNNISEKTGMSPGALVHIGDVLEVETRISLIDYSKESMEEKIVQSIDDILQNTEKDTVTWVNIEGLRNVELIDSIGQIFDIHPLVLEDILNTHQRPKFEEYDHYLYFVLKGLSPGSGKFSVNSEQISILVLDKCVFTFKEKKDDLFLPLKKRLKNSKGQLRNLGSDYLAYAILDLIIDSNFLLLDYLDEITSSVEEELLTNPTQATLDTIQRIKRELVNTKRAISPLREMLNAILRSETKFIHEKTYIYFRDVHDHVLHITESLESYRDILSGLLNIYISSVSNKMNEVMKVLTVFASIFIPLTFIAGIYGMNFENMPELKWKWAYPTLWFFFIMIPLVLLMYFRKKRWL